jgi:metal-sulfur cluster biosynthetic enzyme
VTIPISSIPVSSISVSSISVSSIFVSSISIDAVREALRSVIDPCSKIAGTPLSIVAMGLVSHIACTDRVHGEGTRTDVHITLTVTEPNCVMYHAFAQQAQEVIARMDGVGEIDLKVRPYSIWTEADMEPEAKELLAANRTRRAAERKRIPVASA